MTTDEVKEAKTPRDREQAILARVDGIDSLMSSFIAELRVHVDLLRDEVEHQEGSR